MRRVALSAAALAALVGCSPIFYDVSGTDSDTDAPPPPTTVGPDPSSMTEVTGPDPGETTEVEPPPPRPACVDGLLNGLESDVDCGGPECLPCQFGQACRWEGDCVTNLCDGERCAECLDVKWCDVGVNWCATATCTSDHRCIYEPVGDGAFCDDGDPCTVADACFAGRCSPAEAKDCSGLDDACRVGVCLPGSGNCAFEPINEGLPCPHADPCVGQGVCVQGTCTGKPMPLHWDFSSQGGWLTDDAWQIGPAIPSTCVKELMGVGGEDPPVDHSPSFDEGLAGAMIGGCLPPGPKLEQCLTSPPFFMPPDGAPLSLMYWSRLTALPLPGHAHIDLGIAPDLWVPLFDSAGEMIDERGWTPREIPLEGIAEPGMELFVRFCHLLHDDVPAVAGWSVDDVTVGPPGCFAQP